MQKPQQIQLSTPIDQLPTIGPNTALKFANLNIFTIKDLLFHVPFRYKDTSEAISIKELLAEKEGMIIAKCESISSVRIKRFFITKAKVVDESGKLNITWFNQPYISNQFKAGQTYLIEGKLSEKKGFISMIAPQFEIWESGTDEGSDHSEFNESLTSSKIEESSKINISNRAKGKNIHLGRIVPYYNATAGLTSKFIRSKIFSLQNKLTELINDPLTPEILKINELIPLVDAIKKLHFPETIEEIAKARDRLAFDELLKLAVSLERRKLETKGCKAFPLTLPQKLNEKFMNLMKFSLTTDQESAIKEIQNDVSKEEPMRRLLNGDVGSGKTIVALHACYTAICNGYSALSYGSNHNISSTALQQL
jgi:ATP-dependent DNA helicase RecG